jgi:UDPglucose 6-dehydrogenase
MWDKPGKESLRLKIGIIGCGYVGLVTGLGLAHLGHRILGIEKNPDRLKALEAGELPIYEPGLESLFQRMRAEGRFECADSLSRALQECEVLFICVGTPPRESGEPDLSQVESVLKEIGENLKEAGYRVIVNKSTVPVGSADYVRAFIEEYSDPNGEAVDRPEFDVVSNPEFLREGVALQDTLYPDRIVVGAASERAFERMREIYRPLLERQFEPLPGLSAPARSPEWIETDLRSAELIKYAANAFLAMKISFINEISSISESIGADIVEVARGIGCDRRIGPAFLNAGVGWGGSCFRKDIQALSYLAWEHNCESSLLDATLKVNERQRSKIVQVLQSELKMLKGRTIAVLGLSFKPNTDDCRDSPALIVIDRLLDLGARVRAYDPQARFQEPVRTGFKRLSSPDEALQSAHAAVIMTEWDEIRSLNPRRAKELMSGNFIFDGRNCLNDALWKEAGFHVLSIGR